LGAPVGSAVAGSGDFVERVRAVTHLDVSRNHMIEAARKMASAL